MTRVKDLVKAELERATTWLSTNDVVLAVGKPHGSVGRALRRLWAEKGLAKAAMHHDRYGRMQWLLEAKNVPGVPDAQPPTQTIYKKRAAKKTNRQKKSNGGAVATASTQGDLTMQIEQGVETVVAEWVAAGKKFSAHDVTKELRERVNQDKIQVDPGLAGTAHVGGRNVTKIEHDLVRDAVHMLMTSSKFDYDRAHNGTHFEYFPLPANTVAATPSTDPSAPPAADGGSYTGSSTL